MNERRQRLAGTFQRYAEETRNRASVLRGVVVSGLPQGAASLATILLHAHTLAGSGETMGAVEVGKCGAAIEALVKSLPPGSMPDADQELKLDELSAALSAAADVFDPEAALDLFMAKTFPED